MSLTKVTYSMIEGAYINALDYGASPSATGAQNVTALNAAVAAAIAAKQPLYIPGGTYELNATLNIVPPYGQGLDVYGAGDGTTILYGKHTGKAVVAMIGAVNCSLNNLTLEGDATSQPKCGLVLGRSSASSAGWHTFNKIVVTGSYTVAGVYNVASEGNGWYDLFVIMSAGGAKYGVFIGGQDTENIGGLTASTMIGQMFYNASIYNSSAYTVASVFIEGASGTGNIGFYGGYFVTNANSYVTIRTGLQDGMSTGGPFIFDNVSGETAGTVLPGIAGFKLISTTGGLNLNGLTIRNCGLAGDPLNSGVFIYQTSDLQLKNCFIVSGLTLQSPTLKQLGSGVNDNSGFISTGTTSGIFSQNGSYTPTITGVLGTITTASATATWVKNGRSVTVTANVTITDRGTETYGFRFTLPFNRLSGNTSIGVGRNLTAGWMGVTEVIGTSTADFYKYDGSATGLTNGNYVVTMTYECEQIY